ncbi:MAG: ABC transporter permease, partial [Paenibacillus sp.]|nr:ABC transporter permease [Paenibacillus sp.]
SDGPVFTQGMMYNGIVVSDEMYAKIASQADAWTLSGFQMEDWEDTKDIGSDVDKALMEAREAYYSNRDKAKEPQFDFSSLAGSNAEMKQMYSIMLFSALLVGAVFFIAAGSFLYFRLYTDLEQDKEHYRAIGKIGLKDSELSRIATSQLLLLFFVPIVVAIIHSIFAFTALQSLMNLSITGQTFKVLAGFTVAQILYFLLIRWRYMSHLRQAVR